jgi:hypothetical protein
MTAATSPLAPPPDGLPVAMTLPRRAAYPFSAIVGQDRMKLALVLTAVDPGLGGVLIFGERGTGKSTAVRALAALLPPIEAVAGCPVNSPRLDMVPDWARVSDQSLVMKPTPVVDLPLGVAEDRVVGALDIERAMNVPSRAAKKPMNPAFWPAPTAAIFTSTKSTCWKTISSTCFWTWRNRARMLSTATACRSATRPASFWSAPATPKKANCARNCWTGSACRSKSARRAIRPNGLK